MTDIKPNARALMDEVKREHPTLSDYTLAVFAAQRAIERHEAFKQEVSDAAEEYNEAAAPMGWEGFDRFITPKAKPDPLAGVLEEVFSVSAVSGRINAALEARGLEIREKGQ